MPSKVIPCALCQGEAATVYCVNDDAHLCTGCDASVHAANPLLARHERRPLAALACQAECASVAHTAASSDGDVAVVPELNGSTTPSAAAPVAAPIKDELESMMMPMPGPAPAPFLDVTAPQPAPAAPIPAPTVPEFLANTVPLAAPAPLALYEDAFLGRSLQASDLLDFESDDDLELPVSAGFSFDPLNDCVVPSFDLRPAGGERYLEVASAPLHRQQSFLPSIQPASKLVPLGASMAAAADPAPKPAAFPSAPPAVVRLPQQFAAAVAAGGAAAVETEAQRVQRHRDRQRKKRGFGRAVRYQSRRAYAEIRPRIKGRFVTPEEYAAYQAQAAAAGKPGQLDVDADADASPLGTYAPLEFGAPAPAVSEEDAVVPVPTFVA